MSEFTLTCFGGQTGPDQIGNASVDLYVCAILPDRCYRIGKVLPDTRQCLVIARCVKTIVNKYMKFSD